MAPIVACNTGCVLPSAGMVAALIQCGEHTRLATDGTTMVRSENHRLWVATYQDTLNAEGVVRAVSHPDGGACSAPRCDRRPCSTFRRRFTT